jgi:hypothetical protein
MRVDGIGGDMDRLYTAFISSTYLDLIDVRQRIQSQCLHVGVMPLGMEFFPSTGAGAWAAIEESIDAADFCVFVLAGKYGSIDPYTQISWTHREYRVALAVSRAV